MDKNPAALDSGNREHPDGARSNGGTTGVGNGGGTAGSGGAVPTDAPASRPEAGGWLGSEEAWQRLDAPGCELYVAIKDKLPILHRGWTACGPGCSSAPAVAPLGVAAGAAYRRPFTASLEAGQAVKLRAVADVLFSGKGATLWLSTTEPEGVVNGALLSPGSGCSSSGAFPDRADIWHVRNNQSHAVGRVDVVADLSRASWAEYPGVVSTAGSGSAAGWAMALNSGELILKAWTSAVPVRFTSDETYSLSMVDDVVVWVGYQGKSRTGLWASRFGETPRSLWSSELSALRVAVTPDRHVVWLAASGPNTREGLYETAYWYDAVLTDALELMAIRQGPALPVTAGILTLVARDGFAATEGCTEDAAAADQCPVIVYNWETRQTWILHERPGRFLMRPLAINRHQFVLTENTSNNAESASYVQGVVMLATSELSRVDGGW